MFRWESYRFSKRFGFENRSSSEVTATELGSLVGVEPHFLRFPAVVVAATDVPDFEATLAAPESRVQNRRDSPSTGQRYVRYFRTSIIVHRKGQYTFDFGGHAALQRKAWVDGEEVISRDAGETTARCVVKLGTGPHPVLLRVEVDDTQQLETYAVFYLGDPPEHDPLVPKLQWFDANAPDYEVNSGQSNVGWFRFDAPPGLREIQLNCDADEVEAWANGVPMAVEGDRVHPDQIIEMRSEIALRVRHRRGAYEGAAFAQPIAFECGVGRIPAGDWCDHGLAEYSGGATYRRTVRLDPLHLSGAVWLDLGTVAATAALRVNGTDGGVRMALPFRFDISDLVQPEENEIEVTVVNTLANHMSSYPTNSIYEGQLVSGLLGPARLEFHARFQMDAVLV